MILRISKISLIVLASLLLISCGIKGRIKIYYLDPPVGLVRKQQQEILPFVKAKGYLCESQADFEKTVTCVGGGVKIYSLDPTRGLVRKQQNEVKPFPEAKGYLCTSPQDFQEILDHCAAG